MKILIADDHALFRDSLRSLLTARGFEVVGEAREGREAFELARRLQPDIVLMDLSMPGLDGLSATRLISAEMPQVKVVILTASDDDANLFEAIKSGAQGYLLKNLEAAQFRSMLDAVERGEAAITPATAARIIEEFLRRERGGAIPGATRSPADPDRLTERELDVLELVTRGLRNKEIAQSLGISENTVKFHLKNILEKLHAGSRAELAARAISEGLLRPAAPDTARDQTRDPVT